METVIFEKTGFNGKMYISDSADLVNIKGVSKLFLHSFLKAFPPVEVFFYKSGTAGIDTLEKIKNPDTIIGPVLGGVYIDCQNEKYTKAPPKIKWKSNINGKLVAFWLEMKEGELKGERGEIEVQPSEYEKGMYHNKQMPKFFAPIFHPSIGLETCHFFGGTVYHYPTTETQHENLKKYLL